MKRLFLSRPFLFVSPTLHKAPVRELSVATEGFSERRTEPFHCSCRIYKPVQLLRYATQPHPAPFHPSCSSRVTPRQATQLLFPRRHHSSQPQPAPPEHICTRDSALSAPSGNFFFLSPDRSASLAFKQGHQIFPLQNSTTAPFYKTPEN